MRSLVLWYLLVNAASALAVASDKWAARAGAPRIRERTINLLALSGGWPSSAVVQRFVRHKTRKTRFQVVFWICAMAHCVAVFGVIHWV